MSGNQIDQIVSSAIERIKEISDISSVVGDVIQIGDVLFVPISKLSVGFVVGGGEYGTQKSELKVTKSFPFSGGSGGGVSVSPVGFLCVKNKDVKFIKVDGKTPYEKILETLPKLAESIVEGLNNDKKSQ